MEKFSTEMIVSARHTLKQVVVHTPLQYNETLSKRFGAEIYLKREDLQPVRSYKIRGAYNRMAQLTAEEKERGVVCASAGNHAQGVALSAAKLGIKARIYMPQNTPKQKVSKVRYFGGEMAEIILVGDVFDEASKAAALDAENSDAVFVHPFDDAAVIAGQGTIGAEIIDEASGPIDYLFLPIGGGGLVAGVGSYFKQFSPLTKVIGVEPEGAPSMKRSLEQGVAVTLEKVDTFVDGAAVRRVGGLNFEIAKEVIAEAALVPEGLVCQEMISLYQNDGIVTEPAGVLSIAALSAFAERIKGKRVVCVVSGGNNDISRYPEIIERSLVYQGLKHYFIIEFSQRPGALRRYLDEALGAGDDITLFEYTKKNNRESGPALVGVELSKKEDLQPLLDRMDGIGMVYEILPADSPIFRFLI
jgi:threonine dehydratase